MERIPPTPPLLGAAIFVFALLISGCLHIDDGRPPVERPPEHGRVLVDPADGGESTAVSETAEAHRSAGPRMPGR